MPFMNRFRVKTQEAGGTKLAEMFSTDLAKGESCGRDDCQPCGSERRPNCKTQSILYESACTKCNDPSSPQKQSTEDRIGIYVGESSRSLYERSKEHFADAEEFNKGSHMVKHWITTHPDEDSCPPFKFKVLGSYRDCLSRQVSEALRIQNSTDTLLNSKNEYASNCLARVVVDMSKYERRKQERLEDERDEFEARRLEKFKIEKRRPKRSLSILQEENFLPDKAPKRLKLANKDPAILVEEDNYDIGLWMRLSEEKCLRVGNLKSRMLEEKARVLELMRMIQDQEEGGARHPINQPNTTCCQAGVGACPNSESNFEGGNGLLTVRAVQESTGPAGVGARHPNITPNTRSGQEGAGDGGNCYSSKLTSYAAWWKRMECAGNEFYSEVRKEEKERLLRKKENERKKKEKEDFVKKFFPSCSNSPGGTKYLHGSKEKHSSRNMDVGKIDWNLISENSEILENNLFTQKKVKTLDLNSSDESAIKTFVTLGRNEIADMEKGGRGVSKNLPRPVDR